MGDSVPLARVAEAINLFKQCHNHHKRNPAIPDRLDDLDELLDFRAELFDCACTTSENRTSTRFTPYIQTIQAPAEAGGGPIIIMGLSCYPGFLFFPAALGLTLQRNLTYQALTEYCEAPYRTNIESIPPKPSEQVGVVNDNAEGHGSMWHLWSQEPQEEDLTQQQRRYYRCIQKLSWATLGYFYDWTQRCYHKDDYSPFPQELTALGRVFAHLSLAYLDHPEQQRQQQDMSYDPSACIVNYYGEKGVMGGHRDELELALDKPIVSISLGRPAVFILGGKRLQDGPIIPMIVRSGDVIVLGGDSRLNYHSMSRLLPNTLTSRSMDGSSSVILTAAKGLCEQQLSANDQRLVDRYLTDHRININIRQVYNNI